MEENNKSLYVRHISLNRKKLELVFKAYSALGLLVFVVGLGFFATTFLPVDLTENQSKALLISGVGLAVAVLSRVTIGFFRSIQLERYREEKEQLDVAEFINSWDDFEMIGKSAVSDRKLESGNIPVRVILSRLMRDKKIDGQELIILDNAIRIRNLIVHTGTVLSMDDLSSITKTLKEISTRLMYDMANESW